MSNLYVINRHSTHETVAVVKADTMAQVEDALGPNMDRLGLYLSAAVHSEAETYRNYKVRDIKVNLASLAQDIEPSEVHHVRALNEQIGEARALLASHKITDEQIKEVFLLAGFKQKLQGEDEDGAIYDLNPYVYTAARLLLAPQLKRINQLCEHLGTMVLDSEMLLEALKNATEDLEDDDPEALDRETIEGYEDSRAAAFSWLTHNKGE